VFVSFCETGSIVLQVRTVTGSVCMKHIPPPTGEAGKFDNFVQETFDINFRLTSSNFYDNHGNSSGECCLCDSGVIFGRCALSQDLCLYIMPRRRAPICKKTIIMSFNHLCNILMSLKNFDCRCMLCKKQNPITIMLSNLIDGFFVCDPEIECLVREMWGFMHGVHPEDLEWRLRNREHLVPYLNTSPMDWLNYYVSGLRLKSPQFEHHLITLKM